MRIQHGSLRQGLSLLLMVGLLSACQSLTRTSSYKVEIPLLTSQPLQVPCNLEEPNLSVASQCILSLEKDWQAIVRELKAACLANGQTAKECQVEDTVKPIIKAE